MTEVLEMIGSNGVALVGCVYFVLDGRKRQEEMRADSISREARLEGVIMSQGESLREISENLALIRNEMKCIKED